MRTKRQPEPWEDLIVNGARNEERATPGFQPDATQELAERIDALEFMLEGRQEIPRLARELTHFARDRRNELRSLRRYRLALSLVAVFSVVAVAGFLVYEVAYGFVTFRELIRSEYILAAYVAASLAFILGILLVLLRGVFGAIKDADNAPNLPPQVQEIYEVLKKLGHQERGQEMDIRPRLLVAELPNPRKQFKLRAGVSIRLLALLTPRLLLRVEADQSADR